MTDALAAPRTDAISYAEFVRAYRALVVANRQGYIVDAALDVTWSLYGVTAEENVARLHADLLTALTQWLTAHDLPALYVWAIEEGATFGLHSHITLHLPWTLEVALRGFLAGWLADQAPATPPPDAVPFLLQVFAAETTQQQWRRFRYTMKSTDPWIGLDGGRVKPGEATLLVACGIEYWFGGFVQITRSGVAPLLELKLSLPGDPTLMVSAASPPKFDDRHLHDDGRPRVLGR